MRSSVILASLAMAAVATPLEKCYMETEVRVVETKTIVVTVTAGQAAPSTDASNYGHGHGYAHYRKSNSSSTVSPSVPTTESNPIDVQPEQSSSSVAVVVPTYGEAPASISSSDVQPTYPSTPEPAPTTSELAPIDESTSTTYGPAPTSDEPTPEPTLPTLSTSVSAPSSTGSPSYGVTHVSGKIQATFNEGPDYENAVLWHHNRARANHGASNLEWSDECVAGARKAAETCVFAHVSTSGQGQNLFATSGTGANITAGITEAFYKPEADAYPGYGSEPDMYNFSAWGHYSQMVWKSTKYVGCVTVDCTGKMQTGIYSVCNYQPAGNVGGQYAENIASPIGSYSSYSWLD